jgi:hypothetical protein
MGGPYPQAGAKAPRAARAAIAAADRTATGHQQKRESQKDKRTRYWSPAASAKIASPANAYARKSGRCGGEIVP